MPVCENYRVPHCETRVPEKLCMNRLKIQSKFKN